MKKLPAILLLFVLFGGSGCHQVGKEEKSNSPRAVRQLTVDALVVKLSSKDFAYTYTGTLLANEAIELRAEISGKITHIFFKEGARVNKGDLLVKMFDADLQAQLRKNKLEIELKAKEEKRKRELFDLKGISKEEYEISENQLNTLKAEQDLLNAQISKTELVAPFTGIVGLRNVSVGSFVSANNIITTLQQIDPIKIEFSIPEKYKQNITTNQDLSFKVEGLSETFHGKVYAMESKIDLNTRSIRFRALCSNPTGRLFPNSFATIRLNLFPNQQSVFIPARAIVPLIDGEQVFITRNRKATAVKVVTGIRTETEVEVEKGLAPNDTLILSGLLQIKEGMPVIPKLTREKIVKE